MPSAEAILRATHTTPGATPTPAPQGGTLHAPSYGQFSPLAASLANETSYRNVYGPFLPRPARTFTEGAFGPFSPILPVPVDEPPPGAAMPDPRLFQYQVGWNLPVGEPGSEGLKLAPFSALRSIADLYIVARRCIQKRKDEIKGLEWSIELTPEAAKTYQGDHAAMRDFGERKNQATRFFRRPDPDYWTFQSFLEALLEEIFVYDALSVLFRPKYGTGLHRGLLGSDLDHLSLIHGPTIRPLLGLHGEVPAPPAPAYQQYLYGVPRSDIAAMLRDDDLRAAGLAGAELNRFRADQLLYAPMTTRRWTPYGFPPVEQALIPIMTGLQKQSYQADYYKEGTVPAVYISPGDPNLTPNQIRELQDALNAIAGDPAFHHKVIVLPPGSKVEPQKPVDLADAFDNIVMTQTCMAFDIYPMELGILPWISAAQPTPGSTASRYMAQAGQTIHQRPSTKPLLLFISAIFNYVLQEICGQHDLRFVFEGLADQDKVAATELGIQQVQNGIASIDEIRDKLDMPPWGLPETSEPVVFTAQGPVPFSMAPNLIAAAYQHPAQPTSSGQHDPGEAPRTRQPRIRRGGQTRPNGTHPAPVAPHREALTPAHSAAAGVIQSPTPRTGGTRNRSPVAGSRKKAAAAELEALTRHLRKGRLISTWQPQHLPPRALSMIAEDVAKGATVETAAARAAATCLPGMDVDDLPGPGDEPGEETAGNGEAVVKTAAPGRHWPGWRRDLELVAANTGRVSAAFRKATRKAAALIRRWVDGTLPVTAAELAGLIAAVIRKTLTKVLRRLWREAWHLGHVAAAAAVTGREPAWGAWRPGDGRTIGVAYPQALNAFLATHGATVLAEISETRTQALLDALRTRDPQEVTEQLASLLWFPMRAELIAVTEVMAAQGAAAFREYQQQQVAYKQWVVADADACPVCKANAAEGPIPLSAVFQSGDLTVPAHPRCRCAVLPAWEQPEPVVGKTAAAEDPSRAAFLLLRAPGDDHKWRYLLQKRDDGTWGLPGGKTHSGEHPWNAALRETTEELGDLPPVSPALTLHHRDSGVDVWTFTAELGTMFTPTVDGATPGETHGWGWFKRKEITHLPLCPGMAALWERLGEGRALKTTTVDLNGQPQHLYWPAGAGAPTPVPHTGDGTQVPGVPAGGVPAPTPGGAPPRWDGDEAAGQTWGTHGPGGVTTAGRAGGSSGGGAGDTTPTLRTPHPLPPPGGDDATEPGPRTPGPAGPRQQWPNGTAGGMWPAGGHTTLQPPAAPIGADTPRSRPPSPVGKAGGAADYTDPSSVEAEHVYVQLAHNFPAKAIQWVKRARWIGPIWVPWDRVDTHDEDKWAATHQPARVAEFAREIRDHHGHVQPSVLVQEPGGGRAFIVDGHHRALARRLLGQKVLAYLGVIDPADREAALETHTHQIHQGASPQNR